MLKLKNRGIVLFLILGLVACGKSPKPQMTPVPPSPPRARTIDVEAEMREIPIRAWNISSYASDEDNNATFDWFPFTRIYLLQSGSEGSYLLYWSEHENCAGYSSVNLQYSVVPSRRRTNEPFDLLFQRRQDTTLHVQCPDSELNSLVTRLDFMLNKNFMFRPTSVGTSDIWSTFSIIDRSTRSAPYRFDFSIFSNDFTSGRVNLSQLMRVIRSIP